MLAGGQSRRLGRDKALLGFRGQPLLLRAVRVLQEVFARVVVVSPLRESYSILGVELVEDLVPDSGPLGGLHAALASAGGGDVFLLACDHPYVEAPLVRYLTARHLQRDGGGASRRAARALVARWRGRLYPLCGLYTAACRGPIAERLSKRQLRMHELLRAIETQAVPITEELPFYHPQTLVNLNRPEDLSLLESLEIFGGNEG